MASRKVEQGGRILHPRPLLCSGTPVHFTHYTLMNRSEVDVTLPQFQLPDFGRLLIAPGR